MKFLFLSLLFSSQVFASDCVNYTGHWVVESMEQCSFKAKGKSEKFYGTHYFHIPGSNGEISVDKENLAEMIITQNDCSSFTIDVVSEFHDKWSGGDDKSKFKGRVKTQFANEDQTQENFIGSYDVPYSEKREYLSSLNNKKRKLSFREKQIPNVHYDMVPPFSYKEIVSFELSEDGQSLELKSDSRVWYMWILPKRYGGVDTCRFTKINE